MIEVENLYKSYGTKEIFKNHPYNFAHENFDELKTKLDNLFKETD